MRLNRILLSFMAAALTVAAASKADMHWRPLSEQLWTEAKEQGKPVLLEFWADWCGPCNRMDRDVWTDPRVVEAASKFVKVSVDHSGHHVSGDTFGTFSTHMVRALPTVIIADPWQEVLLVSEGFVHPQELIALLQGIPADFRPMQKASEALRANRSNVRALQAVGVFYQQTGALGIANRYYRDALTKPDARNLPDLREQLLFAVAINEVRRADWRSARKELERFQHDFASSPLMDQVLLGFVVADVRQKRMKEAGKRAAELQSAFPKSAAAAYAAKLIEQGPPK